MGSHHFLLRSPGHGNLTFDLATKRVHTGQLLDFASF